MFRVIIQSRTPGRGAFRYRLWFPLAALAGLTLAGAIGEGVARIVRQERDAPPPAAAVPRQETPEGLPNYMVDSLSASRRVDELARRTRGDFNRLTELEQRWINGMAAGYGHELLRMRARHSGIKPQGVAPRARKPQPAR